MKSLLKYILAAIFTLHSFELPAFAEEGEVHVCSHCISDTAEPGQVVEQGGERWLLDHAEHARGHTIWFATHEGPARGRSMDEGSGSERGPASGASLGSSGNSEKGGPGFERITGHDFSDFEDSKEASKQDREELARYRAKAVARVNEETVVDAEATGSEIQGELNSLNNAVQKAKGIANYGPEVPEPVTNSVDAVAVSLNAVAGNENVSAAEAGWETYDDHIFLSDHKESLEKVRSRLNNSVPKTPQQADAKLAGFGVLDKSDKAYLGFDTALGDQFLHIASVLADIATDVIPVTSIPKDFYRTVVGRDPVDGHQLKNWERYLAAGFIVLTVGTAGSGNVVEPELRALAKAASLEERDLAMAEKLSQSPIGEYGTKLVGETKTWLKDLQLGDGAAHNQHLAENRGYTEPAWDVGRPMLWGKTAKEKRFVRFFPHNTSAVGSWVIDAAQVAGKSPAEIKDFLAVSEVPDRFVVVTIPDGVEIGAGYISKNKFGGGTGGVQYFIPDRKDSYFGAKHELGRIFTGVL